MHKSWAEIASFLRSLEFEHRDHASAVDGIATVAEFVAEAPLNLGLYGWTSMHTLCIQQTDVEPYSGPFLRLSPLETGMVKFSYVDTSVAQRQWARTEAPQQAVGRFVKFLEQLHWVSGSRVAD
jgi:hypothetical protein